MSVQVLVPMLWEENQMLREQVAELQKQVGQLENEVARLKDRVNKTSYNSSKPPMCWNTSLTLVGPLFSPVQLLLCCLSVEIVSSYVGR